MADKRWKAVERGVAEELNRVLSGVGNFSPVERIPLLGRDGPDLTMNETGLVINVKSRQNISGKLFPRSNEMLYVGDLVCLRMTDLCKLMDYYNARRTMTKNTVDPVKHLQDWYDTMEEWTQQLKNGHSTTTIMRHSQMSVEAWTKEFKSNCISAIILHRPRMPYGNCGVVIHYENLRRLSCNLTTK
jgi:hypothetical protein